MSKHAEDRIESMLVDKGKTAPRIKPQDLDRAIASADYHVFPGTTVTVCLLTLHNGYHVMGESAAVSMENFDEEIGREVAFGHAREKLWPLLGYALREELSRKGG